MTDTVNASAVGFTQAQLHVIGAALETYGDRLRGDALRAMILGERAEEAKRTVVIEEIRELMNVLATLIDQEAIPGVVEMWREKAEKQTSELGMLDRVFSMMLDEEPQPEKKND